VIKIKSKHKHEKNKMVKETEYYDTLGISPSADSNQIKTAYKKKALVTHPDKCGTNDKFKKVTEAYTVLSDEEKRQAYDEFGKEGLDERRQGMDMSSMNDMFRNMFAGGGIPGMSQRRNTQTVKYEHTSTLEEICMCKVVKLRFTRNHVCDCSVDVKTCDKCNGRGVQIKMQQIGPGIIQQIHNSCKFCNGKGKIYNGCDKCNMGLKQVAKVYELHLDPSMPDGHTFSFEGEGNQEFGQAPGDFIITLKYAPHPKFVLNNFDLITKRQISLKEALTGYQETFTHPSSEQISIDTTGQIINPNLSFVIPGKGMISKCNLYIEFTIEYPNFLDEKQVEIIKKVL
jgi:DnaJ-class molecular chaperone